MTAEQSIDEELQVLKCIYGEDLQVDKLLTGYSLQYQVKVAEEIAYLVIEVGESYPSRLDSVLVSVNAPRRLKTFYNKAESILESIWEENPGGNVLFTLIDRLAEELRIDIESGSALPASTAISDTVGVERSAFEEAGSRGDEHVSMTVFKQSTVPPARASSIPIIHGPVIVEMRSTFQAHLAAISSMDELNMFQAVLLSDRKIAGATHNILAYRFTCPRTGASYHDYDDDGEAAAGGRLAEMMRLSNVTNVAVVVTRWFGGTLMGPVRFKVINNVARDLLEAHGYIHSGSHGSRKKS